MNILSFTHTAHKHVWSCWIVLKGVNYKPARLEIQNTLEYTVELVNILINLDSFVKMFYQLLNEFKTFSVGG